MDYIEVSHLHIMKKIEIFIIFVKRKEFNFKRKYQFDQLRPFWRYLTKSKYSRKRKVYHNIVLQTMLFYNTTRCVIYNIRHIQDLNSMKNEFFKKSSQSKSFIRLFGK